MTKKLPSQVCRAHQNAIGKASLVIFVAVMLMQIGIACAFSPASHGRRVAPIHQQHEQQQHEQQQQQQCQPAWLAQQRKTPPNQQQQQQLHPYTHFQRGNRPTTCLFASSSSSFSSSSLPDISGMKPNEMRQELESYGISTKSFLEKKELVAALEKARREGATPKVNTNKASTSSTSTGASTAAAADVNGGSSTSTAVPRDARIKQEMEKAKDLKVAELKKELEARGVSTRSFFEKSEFVRAYAEALVDGKTSTDTKSTTSGTQSRTPPAEDYDPSFRDVVMQKMNAKDPRLLQGTVIDIKLR